MVSMATDNSHRVIMGKRVSSSFLDFFYQALFILAGNDILRSLDEFEIWSDFTTDYGVSCPSASKKSHRPILGKTTSSMAHIKAWMHSKFDNIRPRTTV